MIALTHALFGLLLALLFDVNPIIVMIFSLVPDIEFILPTFHRGPLHSPLLLAPFILFSYFYEKRFGLAILIGLVSHLFLDFLTPQGLPIFYPFSKFYLSLHFTWNTNALNWFIIVLCVVLIARKARTQLYY